jgi:NAD(P)-dependent dehydrogenase (short-subunit alcohol dehydrogenase family)
LKLHVLLPRTALTVVGAARDLNKAKAATEQARKEAATHGETFELVELDLANLKSIRACADGLRAKGELFDEMRFASLAALSAACAFRYRCRL